MVVSALTRPVALSRQPGAARRELAGLLGDARWDGDVDGVVLAVHEAMVNADRHGGGLTGATAGFEGDDLVVEVVDRGEGFDVPESPALADATAEKGRGLFLIRQLTSAAHVVRRGRDVHFVLRFHH